MFLPHEYCLQIRNNDSLLYQEIKRISKKMQLEDNLSIDDSISSAILLLCFSIHNCEQLNEEEMKETFIKLSTRYFNYIEDMNLE